MRTIAVCHKKKKKKERSSCHFLFFYTFLPVFLDLSVFFIFVNEKLEYLHPTTFFQLFPSDGWSSDGIFIAPNTQPPIDSSLYTVGNVTNLTVPIQNKTQRDFWNGAIFIIFFHPPSPPPDTWPRFLAFTPIFIFSCLSFVVSLPFLFFTFDSGFFIVNEILFIFLFNTVGFFFLSSLSFLHLIPPSIAFSCLFFFLSVLTFIFVLSSLPLEVLTFFHWFSLSKIIQELLYWRKARRKD